MLTRKPKWAIVGSHLAHNIVMDVRTRLGFITTEHGSTHRHWSSEESVRYIQQVFADYRLYGNLNAALLEGTRVLEIGPGDNLGVALLFVAHGAAEVVCLDKFSSRHDRGRQLRIYEALRTTLTTEQKARFDAAVQLEKGGARFNASRVRLVCGIGIEEAEDNFPPEYFRLIVSRAVLMEVHDPDRAFRVMDVLLCPGGCSIHKVSPLNDYRMFRANGYHSLEFLTIPESVYGRMAAASGKPNRRLRSYYVRRLEDLGYEATIHITKVLGSTEPLPPGVSSIQPDAESYHHALTLANQIRHRLCDPFRSLSDEDLIAEDLFIASRKPVCGVSYKVSGL